TDAVKSQVSSANTVYSSWSPIFRVDAGNIGSELLLIHDGLPGSGIFKWNGDPATLTRFETDARKFPFAVTPTPGQVLIIGAAGGNEVLTSLYYKAGHIDAVELNPVTWQLVTHRYASYDGHLAQN